MNVGGIFMKSVLMVFTFVTTAGLSGCGTQQEAPGPHEVQLAVTDRGFEPPRTAVPRGRALTLVVTRKTEQTCATEIFIPRLNQRQALPLHQPVRIEIPAGVEDTLNYVCGMNMLGGTIVAK
jgi:plastocyanin domain-containing protein